MDLTTAQNIFAVRLYEWSLRDFTRELEEGCPLLCTLGLNNRYVAAFVAWNENLSSNERKSLAVGLTRRCHEHAAKLKGEFLSEEDEFWNRSLYEQTRYYMERLPPLVTADQFDPLSRPANPEECLSALAGNLTPVMGKPSRNKSKIICRRSIDDWKLVTEFTFVRKDKFLTFEYQFVRSDGVPIRSGHPAQGPFPRTLLFFYGLGFSFVGVPSQRDSKPMARVIAHLAEYFIARADPLFAGLGVNE